MSTAAIKIENLSKQYRLGEVGTGTLSHDLNRWWAKKRGKEDPLSKIGDSGNFYDTSSDKHIWALRDINLTFKKGDVVGLIGKNGAGKSTLLKILSKVTKPSTGRILLNGRVSSLLEVGTGFHPEMTGRENIFLNGAIMGMKRSEIRAQFDEIVEFAGVGPYIDTPVKRYSSGMYVRLAFAVAAHLNSDILIVDEVLAVGDHEFQRKCLGKMNEVSSTKGRTIIFVSHNIAAVSNLCQNSILLDKGKIIGHDSTQKVIDYYQNELLMQEREKPISLRLNRRGNGAVKIVELKYKLDAGLAFTIAYESAFPKFKGRLYLSVYDRLGNTILFLDSQVHANLPSAFPGNGTFNIQLTESFRLIAGKYSVNIAMLVNDEWVDHIEGALQLEVPEVDFYGSGKTLFHSPLVHVRQRWRLENKAFVLAEN